MRRRAFQAGRIRPRSEAAPSGLRATARGVGTRALSSVIVVHPIRCDRTERPFDSLPSLSCPSLLRAIGGLPSQSAEDPTHYLISIAGLTRFRTELTAASTEADGSCLPEISTRRRNAMS